MGDLPSCLKCVLCGSREYDTSKEFCSGNKIYSKCGSKDYNPSTEFCSGSTIYSKCGSMDYNPSTQFCSNSTVFSKCGSMDYNPSTQFCSGSTVYSRCGGGDYYPSTEFCSSGAVYSKCGSRDYNPSTEFCSGSTVYSKCGSSDYNPSTEFCSGSAVYSKCGSNDYNPSTEFCSGSTVYSKCGSNNYNPSTEFCSSGTVYFKCGGSNYNPSTEYCSGSTVLSKSSSSSGYGSSSNSFVHSGKGNNISNYKTIVIGTQRWMAENLDYVVEGSKCYSNNPANCNTYGSLYDWSTAMALSSSCNSTSCSSQIQSPHRGICPSGWHIPSQAEWNTLSSYVQNNSGCISCDARLLKAMSGWNNNGNGIDNYGFSALPGGDGGSGGSFGNVGYYGHWWSASESGSSIAYYRFMIYYYEYALWYGGSDTAYWENNDKTSLFSVRCVQD